MIDEMILEFAVDPKLFSSYRQFNELYRHFGFDKRRVIVAFPRKWASRVRKYKESNPSEWTDGQTSKFDAWLIDEQDKFLVENKIYYSNFDSPEWRDQAEYLYENYHSFCAILSSSNPNERDYVICPFPEDRDTEDFRDHRLFQISDDLSYLMKKGEDGFKNAFAKIINNSERIILIDRFFGLDVNKCKAIIRVIFSSIKEDKNTIITIIIPTSSDEQKCKKRAENISNELIDIIGNNKLNLIFIKEYQYTNEMNITHHDRFFISDKCAIRIGPGFAIERPETPEIYPVTMLNRNFHESLYEYYKGDKDGSIPNTIFKCTVDPVYK